MTYALYTESKYHKPPTFRERLVFLESVKTILSHSHLNTANEYFNSQKYPNLATKCKQLTISLDKSKKSSTFVDCLV